jgi:hypothetical protein
MILIVVAGWPSKLAGDYRALGAGVMLGIYGCLLVFNPNSEWGTATPAFLHTP